MRQKQPAKRSKIKPRVKVAQNGKTPHIANGEAGGISHFLQTWATESGMDPETLKKALIKVDYQPIPNERIPFKVIRKALYGEMYEEELRGERLRNDRLERRGKVEDGKLADWDHIETQINTRLVQPLIQALDNAPDAVSREWIEKVMKPAMRLKLKVNGEKIK